MPLLLRTVRQNRWFKAEAEPFLINDDIPADCLGDMPTQGNQLSVWEIEPDRSNIERVIRAVAVGRDRIDHMGYVIFDSVVLDGAGIAVLHNAGVSLDKDANAWHRDLVLTGKKMVDLAKAILQNGEEAKVVLKPQMRKLVEDGIKQGELPASVQQKLDKK